MEVMPGYKQTEVGIIPEDWRVEPLVNSVKLQGGYAFRSIAFCDIGVPVIRISDVQRGSVDIDGAVCHPKIAIPVEFLIQEGDALMAMSGATTGKVGVYRQKQFAYQNQRVGKFVIKDKKRTSSSFIIQLVRSDSFLKRLAVFLEQGAQPNISSSQVESLVFPFPPTLAEQEAIAEALSDTDALIESLEQLIAKKRQIKQGAMQELLTGKKRLPGFSGEWSITRMREILTQNATYGIVTAGAFVQNGVKMVRGGDIADGRVNTDLPMVSRDKAVEYSRTALVRNDVVIALVGYPGEAARIPEELIGSNISRAVGLLRLNSKVSPDYLVCFLNSPNGRRMVLAPSAGSAQQVVNLAALNKLEFSIPELAEQTAIAAILSDMDAEIAALEAKLLNARQLKQGMMQELLTGRIRLI